VESAGSERLETEAVPPLPRRLAAAEPRYFVPFQYGKPRQPAGATTTVREQRSPDALEGAVDLTSSPGLGLTGGTLMGAGARLREELPETSFCRRRRSPCPCDPTVMGACARLEDGYVPPNPRRLSKLDRESWLVTNEQRAVAGVAGPLPRPGKGVYSRELSAGRRRPRRPQARRGARRRPSSSRIRARRGAGKYLSSSFSGTPRTFEAGHGGRALVGGDRRRPSRAARSSSTRTPKAPNEGACGVVVFCATAGPSATSRGANRCRLPLPASTLVLSTHEVWFLEDEGNEARGFSTLTSRHRPRPLRATEVDGNIGLWEGRP